MNGAARSNYLVRAIDSWLRVLAQLRTAKKPEVDLHR
jgi:hypothetical protein